MGSCCIPIRVKEKREPPEEQRTQLTFFTQPSPTRAIIAERKLLERIRLLPNRVNWVEQGVIGPVVNQNNSHACWAFQTVNELNTMFMLATGKSYRFSVQELIDFDAGNISSLSRAIAKRMLRINWDYSGDFGSSLLWVLKHGLSLEKDYPFTGGTPKIPRFFKRGKRTTFKIDDAAVVPYYREDYLKLAVAHHPVLVSLTIHPTDFAYNYKGGIYTPSHYPDKLLKPHGALLVGYDVIEGRKVWYIQNCWGSDWGMDGYMFLPRDVDNSYENCKIAQFAVFPIISSFNCDLFEELDFDWIGSA